MHGYMERVYMLLSEWKESSCFYIMERVWMHGYMERVYMLLSEWKESTCVYLNGKSLDAFI